MFLKRLFLILLVSTGGFTALAQVSKPPGSSSSKTLSLSGKVVDATNQSPVSFATVALQDKAGKTLGGTTADLQGQFLLPGLSPGEYQLVASFIGYEVKTMPLSLAAGQGARQLGPITLAPSATALKEVSITATRNLVEETDDGLVYNAEQDVTSAGGTAADLLKKVPLLAVDADGNLEMRGSNKIKVLINGKPSTMMAANLADALQQIPADMIKTVEVITSPSAKYDSEGTAGVVNIVTKKNALQGLTGTVNGTWGNRSSSANGSLNLRRKKLGAQLNLGGSKTNSFGDSELNQEYFRKRRIHQLNDFDNEGQSGYAQLGLDYDFNDFHNLRGSVRVNESASDNTRGLNSSDYNLDGALTRSYRRAIGSDNGSQGRDINLDYTRKFAKKDQELGLMALYSQNSQGSDYLLNEENESGLINYRESNTNKSNSQELTVQADYQQPLNKMSSLNVGSKMIWRDADSDYLFSSMRAPDSLFRINKNRSNNFTYDQDVWSSYVSYALRFAKTYRLTAGGRAELTSIFGEFISNDTTLQKSYFNFMPNLNLTRSLKNRQRLRVSYSTRIHRPQIQYLNPYRDYSNPTNIRFGNPDLDPELTHNTEAGYSTYFKNTSINTSVYWRETGNDIGVYRSIDTVVINNKTVEALSTTYRHIGRNATYGGSIYASTRFMQKGQAGGTVNVFYTDIHNRATQTRRGGLLCNFNLNASYRFEKDITAQLSGSYNAGSIQAQGRSSSYQRYSAGVRKELWDKKGSLSLNADNFLQSSNRLVSTVENELFASNNVSYQYPRNVRLTLNYRFGKMEFKAPAEKKTIRNDDTEKSTVSEPRDPREKEEKPQRPSAPPVKKATPAPVKK
ncbi:MAG: TonB-dependent receptor domain-containing protein [Adhaeribacter sp.]